MQKTYTAAIYPRFNGLYYTIRFLDFDDRRGNDLEPNEIHDTQLVAKNLQQIIDNMVKEGQSIPEPKDKTYMSFTSDYGNEIHYMNVTVTVPN